MGPISILKAARVEELSGKIKNRCKARMARLLAAIVRRAFYFLGLLNIGSNNVRVAGGLISGIENTKIIFCFRKQESSFLDSGGDCIDWFAWYPGLPDR